MSLVNEALKRARAEAAAREGHSSGPRPGHVPIATPPPRTSRVVSILALLGVVFLVGLVAGAVTFVRNRAAAPPVETAATSAPAASDGAVPPSAGTAEPAAANSPPAAEPTPSPPAASSTSTETTTAAGTRPPEARTAQPQPVAPSPPAPRREASTPAPGPAAIAPAPSTEPAPRTSRTPDAERTVAGVRKATARDGRTFDLGGIAWSDSGPFALVNGRVLAAGERIEGFEIAEIHREWVRLVEGDEEIVLRLR